MHSFSFMATERFGKDIKINIIIKLRNIHLRCTRFPIFCCFWILPRLFGWYNKNLVFRSTSFCLVDVFSTIFLFLFRYFSEPIHFLSSLFFLRKKYSKSVSVFFYCVTIYLFATIMREWKFTCFKDLRRVLWLVLFCVLLQNFGLCCSLNDEGEGFVVCGILCCGWKQRGKKI